jgi:hypothetical protein
MNQTQLDELEVKIHKNIPGIFACQLILTFCLMVGSNLSVGSSRYYLQFFALMNIFSSGFMLGHHADKKRPLSRTVVEPDITGLTTLFEGTEAMRSSAPIAAGILAGHQSTD